MEVSLPLTAEHEVLYAFKQAHRRDDDIAIVNAAMRFQLAPPVTNEAINEARWTIREASVAYGGVGPTVVFCNATNKALKQQPLTSDTLQVRGQQLISF